MSAPPPPVVPSPACPLPAAPAAMRLITADREAPAPKPPLGVAAWSDAGDGALAIAVLPQVPRGLGDIAVIASSIPNAVALAPGTLVIVLGSVPASQGGLLGRFLKSKPTTLARATRASALLARGYVSLGAAYDPASKQDLVWGYASASLE